MDVRSILRQFIDKKDAKLDYDAAIKILRIYYKKHTLELYDWDEAGDL